MESAAQFFAAGHHLVFAPLRRRMLLTFMGLLLCFAVACGACGWLLATQV